MSVDPVRASVIRFVPRYFALSVRRRGLDLINRLGLAQLASAAGPRYLRIAQNRLNARSLESISRQNSRLPNIARPFNGTRSYARVSRSAIYSHWQIYLAEINRRPSITRARARAINSVAIGKISFRGSISGRAFVIAWKPAHLT